MFPDGANLRLFKQGIAPMWEDPCNENGGKWTLSCYREQSHNIALKSLLALIGEQLDHSHDIVCKTNHFKNKQTNKQTTTYNIQYIYLLFLILIKFIYYSINYYLAVWVCIIG